MRGVGGGVQVAAIQLAELLAELPDIEPEVSRQPGPVCVAFLDAHVAILEAHKDLRGGVWIERRLEADLELPRVEIVPLDTWPLRVAAHLPPSAALLVPLRVAPPPPP